MKALSIASFLVIAGAVLGLLATHRLLSSAPVVIIVQIAALGLMVWARVVFGFRSFHAAANPTEGGLIKTGPYRFIRHPVYTAVVAFVFTGALAHFSLLAVVLALVVLAGSIGRMLSEEHLLRQRYPDYAEYAAKTSRMIPYAF